VARFRAKGTRGVPFFFSIRRVRQNLLNFSPLDRDPKLDGLATDLTVFNVLLVARTDIDENVETLSAVRTVNPSGCFHMPPQCLQPVALTIALFLSEALSFSAHQPKVQSQPVQALAWSRWIELARQKALDYSETLPDFVCAQTTRRYSATAENGTWLSEDVWEAELSYNQKAERYSQIRLNGRASRRSLESLGGALSIGEFGSLLRALFLPETQAEFWKEGEEQFQGRAAIVVGFRVSQERSGWTLSFKKSHSLRVAYSGRAWIDTSNYQILKISQQTLQLPPTFPIAYSEATTVYSYISVPGLDGKHFLLPQTAHLILHERQPPIRSLNVINFRNYRKFTADVRLVPE
jgi:hypothetical protein